MPKYKHIDTGEVVEAEVLPKDQGVVDEGHKDYDENRGRTVEFAAGIYVLVHGDGTITTMHPNAFDLEWKKL